MHIISQCLQVHLTKPFVDDAGNQDKMLEYSNLFTAGLLTCTHQQEPTMSPAMLSVFGKRDLVVSSFSVFEVLVVYREMVKMMVQEALPRDNGLNQS